MTKKRSEGKVIGSIAFIVSEIIVVLGVFGIILKIILDGELDSNLISAIFFFQGTVFTVTWGAKASSNFAKKEEEK